MLLTHGGYTFHFEDYRESCLQHSCVQIKSHSFDCSERLITWIEGHTPCKACECRVPECLGKSFVLQHQPLLGSLLPSGCRPAHPFLLPSVFPLSSPGPFVSSSVHKNPTPSSSSPLLPKRNRVEETALSISLQREHLRQRPVWLEGN